MLALVDGQPRVLTLKEMLGYYLEHQKGFHNMENLFLTNKQEVL